MGRFRIKSLLRYLGVVLIFSTLATFRLQNKRSVIKVDSYLIDEEFKLNNHSNSIRVFNLNRSLEPKYVYDSIVCVKSSLDFVSTTLCPHHEEDDSHVSSAILIYSKKANGIWEESFLRNFMNILDRLKDAIVIDVGAHIGQFSLFAAKIGHNVVAIEPFYDNIIRFHKAVVEEGLQSQIRLITSAVSDESNQILPLQKVEKNIGGQYLLKSKEKFSRQDRVWNKYLVETMLFDDILDYLPKASNNKTQTAILKIDIEGFEPYAFSHAQKLFAKLDIRFIFMEWGIVRSKAIEHEKAISEMIEFLSKKYFPMSNDIILKLSDWRSWPWNIVWLKN